MQGQFNTNHLRVLVVTESLLKPKTTTKKKKKIMQQRLKYMRT